MSQWTRYPENPDSNPMIKSEFSTEYPHQQQQSHSVNYAGPTNQESYEGASGGPTHPGSHHGHGYGNHNI